MMVSRDLQNETLTLNLLLGNERVNCDKEHNWAVQLSGELERTKEQLARQKSLKQICINRGKETREELECLQRSVDTEIPSTGEITTQVQKEKKLTAELQVEKDNQRYEAEVFDSKNQVEKLQFELDKEIKAHAAMLLQVRNLRVELDVLQQKMTEEINLAEQRTSEQGLTTEFEAEIQRSMTLQEELEKVMKGYEAEVLRARHQAENLQHELEKEMKAHAATVTKDLLLEKTLREEIDNLQQKMTKVVSVPQQKTSDQDLALETELEELKTQLNSQLVLNCELTTKLGEEKEKNTDLQETSYLHTKTYEAKALRARLQAKNLQHELEKQMKAHAAKVTEDLLLEKTLRAEIDSLQQKITKEVNVPQQKTSDQDLALKTELEELRAQLNSQLLLNRELTAELEVERNSQASQEDMDPSSERSSNQPLDEAVALIPRPRSTWTRIRHSLGLRKPKRWKRSREAFVDLI